MPKTKRVVVTKKMAEAALAVYFGVGIFENWALKKMQKAIRAALKAGSAR